MLAERLAPHLLPMVDQRPARSSDEWLDSHGAANYLGISRSSLHKLSAERAIPFEQEGPGCKLWFRRSDLDAWRAAGGARAYRRR
jgi:excisionase family DNA binding protein